MDGAERAFDYDNPQGLMEFSLEPGRHAVQVDLEDTPVRFWATWVSLLALVLLVASPWLMSRSASIVLRRSRPAG